jgi:glycerate kinase
MRTLVAPDKFKGTYSATELADAICAALGPDADRCPVADGGDGTAEVLLEASGGRWVEAPAHDALGEPIRARFALLGDGMEAVVEVAEASGLARLSGRPLRPLKASSEGTGELIAAAISAGAERVLVACGGSATTDAGLGALARFDPAAVELLCLCDVSDRFAGALRYAPQKGAGEGHLAELAARLETIAAELPHDPSRLPFTGAAGGLAGGFWAHGARLVPGARHVLAAVGFDRRLGAADAVITGEGCLDETSMAGKAVGEIASRAAAAGRPCHAIVGVDRLAGTSRERFATITEAGTAESIATAAAAAVQRRPT